MNRHLTALVSSTLIALSLPGCVLDSAANTAVEVPFTVVATGYYSGIASERFEVIKDHSIFTGLWLDHAKGFSPAPAQPDIDFSRDMVIATFLGERATGGYHIAISGVEEQEGEPRSERQSYPPGRQLCSDPGAIAAVSDRNRTPVR